MKVSFGQGEYPRVSVFTGSNDLQKLHRGLLTVLSGEPDVPCRPVPVFNNVAYAAHLDKRNVIHGADVGNGSAFHILADGFETALKFKCPLFCSGTGGEGQKITFIDRDE